MIAVLQGWGQAAGTAVVAAQAGVPQVAASSLKAALDMGWDDPAARDTALARVLGLLDQVGAFVAGWAGEAAAAAAVAVARQVRDQDVDCSGPVPSLRRGVARDRRISVEDGDMRHGRKSRSVLVDGYKRHALRDLDTGLVPVVGITPANVPEAAVADDIAADLEAAGWRLSELHIDRAYLSSALVRDRGPDLAVFCKAWRVRNTGGRYAKDPVQHRLRRRAADLSRRGGHVHRAWQDRALPERHMRGLPAARSLHDQQQRAQRVHPPRRGAAGLRRRQQTPEGRAKLRERTQVGVLPCNGVPRRPLCSVARF